MGCFKLTYPNEYGASSEVPIFYLPHIGKQHYTSKKRLNYSAFGVTLHGRNFTASGADKFRYGFNAMELDNELKGEGNSYTTEFRQYDSRLGRWLSLDPLSAKFPWQSPYVAFDNNPILLNDPKGLAAQGGKDYDKGEKGSRKRSNTNGTNTYDAPVGEVTLPERAKILSTLQDANNNGKVDYNGKTLEGEFGDLYKFEIDGVVYTSKYSNGKFLGYVDSKGNNYSDSKLNVNNTDEGSSNSNEGGSNSSTGVEGDPIELRKFGNPKSGEFSVQQADAIGVQIEGGFAFVGGMSMYTGYIEDYKGGKLYYKGYSGNIGVGWGGTATFFIVRSTSKTRFTVDQFVGRGEQWSGGAGIVSATWGGTDGPDKYTVLGIGPATGAKAGLWWSGTRTTTW